MKEDHKEHKKEEAYYVGIRDSTQVRREILETARAVVQTVSAHTRIRDIQEEKLRLRTELAQLIRHIREDLHKLEHVLPEPKGPVPDVPAAQIVSTKRKPAPDHRLDKIELALREIEQRMRSL